MALDSRRNLEREKTVVMKFLEGLFSQSGSYRTDIVLEALRISQRCAIGFDLTQDEAFQALGRQALLAGQVFDDPNATKDAQLSTAREMVRKMGEEATQLEISKGLSERISVAYDEEEIARGRKKRR